MAWRTSAHKSTCLVLDSVLSIHTTASNITLPFNSTQCIWHPCRRPTSSQRRPSERGPHTLHRCRCGMTRFPGDSLASSQRASPCALHWIMRRFARHCSFRHAGNLSVPDLPPHGCITNHGMALTARPCQALSPCHRLQDVTHMRCHVITCASHIQGAQKARARTTNMLLTRCALFCLKHTLLIPRPTWALPKLIMLAAWHSCSRPRCGWSACPRCQLIV